MNFFRQFASNLVKGPVPGDAAGEGGPDTPSDAELVNRCQEGDYSAFDALVTKHRGRVYAMIQNMVRNMTKVYEEVHEDRESIS